MMRITDLIRDQDGTMSHTKLWANVASAMACFQLYKTDSTEMVGLILAILVTGRVASKAVDVYSNNKGVRNAVS